MAKNPLDLNNIDWAFQALNEELEARNFPRSLDMLLTGGIVMLLEVHNRESTQDVDAIIGGIDLCYEPLSTEARLLKTAIRATARRLALKQDWLNDDIAQIVLNDTPDLTQFPVSTWKRYSKLTLKLPPLEFVLIHKILAYRPKDRQDVQALCQKLKIRTRPQAQALLDTYVSQEAQQDALAPRALDQMFEEA